MSGSTLIGRLSAFFVGFGVASVISAKIVVDAVESSKKEVVAATAELAARVKVLEEKK